VPEVKDSNDQTGISESFLKKLNSIKNIPTLPVILQKLGKEIRNPASDAKRIARIIEDDPAMMARILRVVNSAFYAAAEPVTSIQMAVARIGMTAVNNIAMSTAVFSAFGKAGTEFNRQEFWKHSICTGIAASVLYERVRPVMPERFGKDILHLSGLLHDIGKIIFEQFFHSEFLQSVKKSETDKIPLYEAEKLIIGESHMNVGAWIGQKWNIADELKSVILFHHDPDRAGEKHWGLPGLVHVANYICVVEKLGNGGDSVPISMQPIWDRFGLAGADISAIVATVNEESRKSEVLMTFANGK